MYVLFSFSFFNLISCSYETDQRNWPLRPKSHFLLPQQLLFLLISSEELNVSTWNLVTIGLASLSFFLSCVAAHARRDRGWASCNRYEIFPHVVFRQSQALSACLWITVLIRWQLGTHLLSLRHSECDWMLVHGYWESSGEVLLDPRSSLWVLRSVRAIWCLKSELENWTSQVKSAPTPSDCP